MDQKTSQNRDPDVPNRASNMEQAEGSREAERGSDTGTGISNRDEDREREEQQRVPPRGRDAGRTMGGGNLGHGRERDAVMPDDEESSLNTKI
jgi:hypothetical protein